jgi:hypothetical protein
MKHIFAVALLLFINVCNLLAAFEVVQEGVQQIGFKSLVKLKLTNKFGEKINSARASVFLMDAQGKVVAQSVKWIIDGSQEMKGLKPDAVLKYTFVLNNDKPFTTAKVTITRIVLESGKVVTPTSDKASPPSAAPE